MEVWKCVRKGRMGWSFSATVLSGVEYFLGLCARESARSLFIAEARDDEGVAGKACARCISESHTAIGKKNHGCREIDRQ